VVSVRREVKPTPVTAQERDSARQATQERMRRTNPAWTWSGPDIPRNKPYYADIVTGDDGRIWIAVIPELTGLGRTSMGGRMGAGGGQATASMSIDPGPPPRPRPALYDVYEPDGTWLAQVEIPPRVSTGVRRGDHVWGIELDEDDVQRIVRYRIAWR
jgi:hypothetical protein